MNTRIPLDLATRKAIHKRDGRSCHKCGRRNELEIHHIQAVVDGGSNEVENLVTLCRICHDEWHRIARPFGLIPIERWLELPPAAAVLYWLVTLDDDPAIDATTFGEARAILRVGWEMARERARTSP